MMFIDIINTPLYSDVHLFDKNKQFKGKHGQYKKFTTPDNYVTDYLEISLDGGSTIYDRIFPTGYVSDLIKGNSTTQLAIRGFSSSVKYKVILDRELP